jgi:hypothetical protein
MANPYLDKIQGFGAPRKWGKAERKPVIDENDGTHAGYHVEHWDDHVDAVAQPKTLEVEVAPRQLGEEE